MTLPGWGRKPVRGASGWPGATASHRGPPGPGPRPLRLCRQPAYVEQRRAVLRCAEHPDPGRTGASELRYAATVTIWVRWTFQPACGAETSYPVEHGALSSRPDRRHPAAAPQRAVPGRGGENLRRLPPNRLERRAAGVAAKATLRHAGITGGAAALSLNSASTLS